MHNFLNLRRIFRFGMRGFRSFFGVIQESKTILLFLRNKWQVLEKIKLFRDLPQIRTENIFYPMCLNRVKPPHTRT